jgi:hypothetical protein
MASLLDLLGRAKTEKKVAYGDTTYLPINDTQSLNSQVSKYEERPGSLEKVLKKELKKPINGINDLFFKFDRLIIDTRGVINPYRTKILTEKYQANTTGGEILRQAANLAGAILKQRRRIPDTIFPHMTKPGPISNTLLQPQNAGRGEKNIEADTPYYVQTQFKPGAEILASAARATIAGDMRAAKQALLQAGLNLGRSLGRSNKQKYNDEFIQSSYHPAAFDINLDGRVGGKKGADNGEDGKKSFYGFKEYYKKKDGAVSFNGVPTTNGFMKTLKKRTVEEALYTTDDYINALVYGKFPVAAEEDEALVPWVKMHPIGYDGMYFPGTIAGLNEQVQSTWENFKYIGSPFSAYKYNGVERTLNFTLNLYWTQKEQIFRIKEQIEFIKELCFPTQDASVARYGKMDLATAKAAGFGMRGKQAKLYQQLHVDPHNSINDAELKDSDQLFYRPQFLELTIHGYAKRLFGFMESINVNIPDTATWPSTNINSEYSNTAKPEIGVSSEELKKGLKNTIYPSNLTVEITFKIIENAHAKVDVKNNKASYKYNLDGYGADDITNKKYPSRQAFVMVPETDVSKRYDTPYVDKMEDNKLNTPKKITPIAKGKKNKNTPTIPTPSDSKAATNTDKGTLAKFEAIVNSLNVSPGQIKDNTYNQAINATIKSSNQVLKEINESENTKPQN